MMEAAAVSKSSLVLPNVVKPRVVKPRVVLGLAVLGGAAASLALVSRSATTLDVEWQLALLLRFMAVLKGIAALVAFALALWRGGERLAPWALAGYGLGVATMAAAPLPIWSLAHVAAGAALFHGGLLVFLLTACRDDRATAGWSTRAFRRTTGAS